MLIILGNDREGVVVVGRWKSGSCLSHLS